MEIIPASSFREMGIRLLEPDKLLLPWVQCIWKTEGLNRCDFRKTEKLYPDGGSSLTFKYTSDGIKVSFVRNTHTLYQTLTSHDKRISIRLRPTGAHRLFGLHVGSLEEEHYDLADLLSPHCKISLRNLVDQLSLSKFSLHITLIENWLKHRLATAHTPELRVENIVAAARNSLLKPVEMAEHCGMTRRTLERKLHREVGVSPNQLIHFYRVYRARQLLLGTHKPLVDIALQCGYYDQSHFANTFHKITYESPGQYRRRKLSQISNL